MKALTIWQPWAQLVVIGAKHIETHAWYMRYHFFDESGVKV